MVFASSVPRKDVSFEGSCPILTFFVTGKPCQSKYWKISKMDQNIDMGYSFHVFCIAAGHVSLIECTLCFRFLSKKQNRGLLDHRCLSAGPEI